MKLARAIAVCFVSALQRLGTQMPPQTMAELTSANSAVLPALRAQAGVQPRASKLPPLIPTFGAKIALTGFKCDLFATDVNKKLGEPTVVVTVNAPTTLPKGSKLLQTVPALLPPTCLQRGVWVSGQQLGQKPSVRTLATARAELVKLKFGGYHGLTGLRTADGSVWAPINSAVVPP